MRRRFCHSQANGAGGRQAARQQAYRRICAGRRRQLRGDGDGLGSAFGDDIAKLMGAEARYFAAIWEAAFDKTDTSLPSGVRESSGNSTIGIGEGVSGQGFCPFCDTGQHILAA